MGGTVAVPCFGFLRINLLNFLYTPLSSTSHCVRVNPSMANRMVVAARSVLNKYLPDVYIYTDVVKGAEGGK